MASFGSICVRLLLPVAALRWLATASTSPGGCGIEARFGISQSATFAAATTLTSTGAVNSFYDSYTALGGMVPIVNMMLGEVAPGGTGSGLLRHVGAGGDQVFVARLMVGRTPEYVGKKIGSREIKFASLYFLVTPILVLVLVEIPTAAGFWTATALGRTKFPTIPESSTRVRASRSRKDIPLVAHPAVD